MYICIPISLSLCYIYIYVMTLKNALQSLNTLEVDLVLCIARFVQRAARKRPGTSGLCLVASWV